MERGEQYETALDLLRLVQVDYRRARKELEDVSHRFAEREAVAGRQLRTAMSLAGQLSRGRESSSSVAVCLESPRLPFVLEGPESLLSAPPTVPSLEVYCLGKFRVRVNWKTVEHWPSTKAKSLLKYLIAQQGRPVPRDILMEALWPGCEPSLANNNLKAAVRALRQTLGQAHAPEGEEFAWVLFQNGSYTINPEADLWVDVGQFEYHWQTARRLERDGKTADATGEHGNAADLYKGDYLEDDLYEEWTSLRREALKDIYLAIVGRLADHSAREADYDGCIAYCQEILTRDPCREDAYRRLMLCYSRLGQRNRAIAWYRLCEKTISSELDVGPDPQTTALHQKLLDGEEI